jgi:hypothetical protein
VYSTCIHCHSALGSNDSVEKFAVGRRLAFDAAKGRLWVVCPRCRRWNLTPLDERWEAIEDCERQYRGTRLRASTDNIGLARLSSGLELIRVGAPLQPEMAAWRYAPIIRRRWLTVGVPLTIVGGGWSVMQLIAPVLGLAATIGGLGVATAVVVAGSWRSRRARVVLPDGRVTTLGPSESRSVIIVPTPDGQWGITTGDTPGKLSTGPRATHTLRAVMTARNFAGASKPVLDDALGILTQVGDASKFVPRLARAQERTRNYEIPHEIAIALEMALHDDVERRALEGEIQALRDEWIMAEEIAGIADNLFLPEAGPDGTTQTGDGR